MLKLHYLTHCGRERYQTVALAHIPLQQRRGLNKCSSYITLHIVVENDTKLWFLSKNHRLFLQLQFNFCFKKYSSK